MHGFTRPRLPCLNHSHTRTGKVEECGQRALLLRRGNWTGYEVGEHKNIVSSSMFAEIVADMTGYGHPDAQIGALCSEELEACGEGGVECDKCDMAFALDILSRHVTD